LKIHNFGRGNDSSFIKKKFMNQTFKKKGPSNIDKE
jgi:hypothetical protein